MKNKMTIEKFKQYVISEAKKLYQIKTLKEEKKNIEKELYFLNETSFPVENIDLSDSETLKKIRQEMLKKAAGWDFSQPKQLAEIDNDAMKTAKKDIEDDGGEFEPLGTNRFEKNISKKTLHKAMSPESSVEKLKNAAE